jgi:putative addiction module component (TIGR02574 family)
MATLLTQDQLSKLSVQERIKLIGLIWDSLEDDDVPLPAWHEEILDKRLKRMEEDPQQGVSWEEVREKLRRKREANAKADS